MGARRLAMAVRPLTTDKNSGHRFGHRFGTNLGSRQKGFPKGFFKIIAALKIRPAVLVGFREQAGVDHVEDDLAEVRAALHTPFLENGHHHGTELLEGEIPDAAEQLLSTDVAWLTTGFFGNSLLGVV